MIELKKAQRKRARLRLGMSAPSGGGKTLGALLIAYGLLKEKYPTTNSDELWSKIAIIDTENGSGELYVGKEVGGVKIGEYNAITLSPPFEAEKYTQSLEVCVDAGMEVAIIDSTTHLWSGQGGLLEQQSNIAKRTGNSYTAWRDITPQHNRFVDAMLQSDIHVIATMRSKQEYVQEKNSETGKTVVRKLGLNPIQKDGMEYEFTVFLEIDSEHNAFGSKDRTGIVDQKYFIITPKLGQELMKWLESGTDEPKQIVKTYKEPENEPTINEKVVELCKELGGSKDLTLMAILKKYQRAGNPNAIKDPQKLKELFEELKNLKSDREKSQENGEN